MSNNLDKLIETYKNKQPEVIFEWNDVPTGAKGWVVINSLKNGAAGGGTRMRKGLTKDEVVSLSKVMEVKFTVSGPPIGGAKSGIDFDPKDPRKHEVLQRWYRAVTPLLKSYYGTGGDLNIDELKDVIPITEELGLWHPQEGIVNGHLQPREGKKIAILGQLRQGVSKIIEDNKYKPITEKKYAIADMVTGFGVAEAVKHFYSIFHNTNVEGKKVIIQGWGNVASAAGFYLAKNGAKIVGIIDKDGGIIRSEGLEFDEVSNLFVNKTQNQLSNPEISFEEANNLIWDMPCDIFIPGAASKLLTRNQIDRLINKGLEVISCGANVPFEDDKIFFGETASYVDGKISLIPDFIANCGMARVFAYLMQPDVNITDESIFFDISNIIYNSIQDLYIANKSNVNISQRALLRALNLINKKI